MAFRLPFAFLCAAALFFVALPARAQDGSGNPASGSSSEEARLKTVEQEKQGPQRIPRQSRGELGAVEGVIRQAGGNRDGRVIAGALVSLRLLSSGAMHATTANGEGVFRLLGLPPGEYELKIEADGFQPFAKPSFAVAAGELVMIEVSMVPVPGAPASRVPGQPELGPALPAEAPAMTASYHEWRRRPDTDPDFLFYPPPDVLVPSPDVYTELPDRWHADMPEYRRYAVPGEFPFVKGHIYDPFNRNILKGDYPIWPAVLGRQTFLNLTGVSDTFVDGRDVPVPSNVSAANPGSSTFFGKGQQFFLDQTFRVTFDLFHGDTSFKPVDWRIRVTPEASLNYLDVRELGIVGPDVRDGTTRFDTHVGLQEAFFEYKIADLSDNYDFISVRAGIQKFNSDFRGFLFVDEQPGFRIFGNASSNKWEYNAAYFQMLEKNTNSDLNTFDRRKQQVLIGNVYRSDFFKKGYTAEFLIAWNKDDGDLHFDDNGFLVRPAPVGNVIGQGTGPNILTHGIRVGYFGWLGNGHFGRTNITHAFYEAVGSDSLNPIAGRKVTIASEFGAVELSRDYDWVRFRVSGLFASGDANPRDGRAHGFDSIVDEMNFAGGIFSFFNRESIRLTGSAVSLNPGNTLLPDLRSNKDEGQANFVNPGIIVVNAGADFDVTPKLRAFLNLNYLRFDRTEPLELILFEHNIRHDIGLDYGAGFRYRPPLSENIVLTFGGAGLAPGSGFRDIYTAKALWSVFAKVTFVF
ncbi:MAG TPA: carboxypeptidase-like regulatory domain-containing protein [Candidatus Acidoferrales bacterium]|nr:carboxypeptidase-like regulatory domain-containing protein [Candidatus Acidoferrales bacterium]